MRQIIRGCLQIPKSPLTKNSRAGLASTLAHQRSPQGQRSYSTESSLPRVAQPSLWQSIVPKFLRTSNQPQVSEKARRSKEWNPATFFIVMFLLIGSNAMQLLALRNDFTTHSRRVDAKIGLLKEVIERVQKGEDVDVKGLLGTGDPEKEKEWEQVIKEVEEEDRLWQAKARRRQKKAERNKSEEPEASRASDKTSSPNEPATEDPTTQPEGRTLPATSAASRRFY
ncbi:hypothetical protein XPA_001432 [Xanthoria parietina]